ncbi:MAG: hypothetical protein KDI33_16545 [Halioglobus sp.]|nr:hypothetical protein [Halioglobus sp.]
MTEYEYIELISTFRSENAFHSMNMFTLFVAYVLAAHYAGRDMSSIQVTALTFLYSVFALTPITATIASTIQFQDLVSSYHAAFPAGTVGTLPPRLVIFVEATEPVTFTIAWLLSLAYMRNCRILRTE